MDQYSCKTHERQEPKKKELPFRLWTNQVPEKKCSHERLRNLRFSYAGVKADKMANLLSLFSTVNMLTCVDRQLKLTCYAADHNYLEPCKFGQKKKKKKNSRVNLMKDSARQYSKIYGNYSYFLPKIGKK